MFFTSVSYFVFPSCLRFQERLGIFSSLVLDHPSILHAHTEKEIGVEIGFFFSGENRQITQFRLTHCQFRLQTDKLLDSSVSLWKEGKFPKSAGTMKIYRKSWFLNVEVM